MVKKKEEFTEHMIRLLGYKWEFLRRNYDYIEDYKLYKNRSGLLKNKAMLNHFEAHICNKYGLREPYDPQIPFDFDLIKRTKAKKKLSKEVVLKDKAWEKNREILLNLMSELNTGVYCKTKSLSDKELKEQSTIEIAVDLDVPKKKILQEVGRIVNEWQIKRAKVVPEKIGKLPKFSEFDIYIEAYHLSNEGWPWDKLAKKYFPKEVDEITDRATDSARRKAKEYYDKCWELIYGGYRRIR